MYPHPCEFVDSDINTGDWILCSRTATEYGPWYPEDPFPRYCSEHKLRPRVDVSRRVYRGRQYLRGDAAVVRHLRIKLMIFSGLSRREVAQEIGLSYNYVCILARTSIQGD